METQKHKLTKSEVKGPDAFVHSVEVGWHAVEKHKTIVFGAVGIIVALGAAFSGMNWWKDRTENKAHSAYYAAKKALDDQKKLFEKKMPDPFKSGDKAKKEADAAAAEAPAKLKTGDIEKDFGPQVAELETVINTQAGTKAAALAAIELSTVFVEYKQGERWVKDLEKAGKGLKSDELLFGLLNMNLGSAYQLAGNCAQAIQVWQQVTKTMAFNFLQGQALLNQAICLESTGQKDKAAEIYRQLAQDYAESDVGKSAKAYLRLMSNDKT